MRNSTIEKLRIFAMLGIVFSHFATYGQFIFNGEITISRLFWCIMELGGSFGVVVFILISGYYLIDDDNWKLNIFKVLKIWGQIEFYSIACYLLSLIVGINNFGIRGIISTIMPVTFEGWWFASGYIILYIIHPFINRFLNSLSKKEFLYYIGVIVFLWQIIPTFTASYNQSNSLIQMLVWYSIGGFIKKYMNNYDDKNRLFLKGWIICEVLLFTSAFVFMLFELKFSFFSKYTTFFYSKKSIILLACAIFCFLYFITKKETSNKTINRIASFTFGVYLFHENFFMRQILWDYIFNNTQYINSSCVIIYSLFAVITIFVFASFVDFLRQITVDKVWDKIINRIISISESYKCVIVKKLNN